jgi:hypothetical protein
MPLGGLQTYPITEPSSVLRFQDLLVEVAYKIGNAYYGTDGTTAPQVPIDAHDLYICSTIVNKGIRMFLNDGPPPNGWKFLRPIAQVDVWPMIAADSTGITQYITSTGYNSTSSLTTLTLTLTTVGIASSLAFSTAIPTFYPTMELQTIYLGGNPPAGTPGWQLPFQSFQSTSTVGVPFTIVNYLSSTQIQIFGQPASSTFSTGAHSTDWSMIATGDYTMPADFSGQYVGDISYISNTNRGMQIHWTDEASIRQRRQNFNFESGTPYEAAIRLMPTSSITPTTNGQAPLTYAPMRRRWQLMTWRISNEFLHVLFPYQLGFQYLLNMTDTPPSPFAFDETLKAAILAQAEFDVENQYGVAWNYYKQQALPKAFMLDAMSAPKKMGYFGNPTAHLGMGAAIRDFRNNWYQRPTVSVNNR